MGSSEGCGESDEIVVGSWKPLTNLNKQGGRSAESSENMPANVMQEDHGIKFSEPILILLRLVRVRVFDSDWRTKAE